MLGAALPLLVLAVLVGCASTGARSPGQNFQVITAEELAETHERNLYDAVKRLRPNWLQARGQGSFMSSEEIRVYVDGGPRGTLGALRTLNVGSVVKVERLRSLQATQRFGIDHPNGAILVYSRS